MQPNSKFYKVEDYFASLAPWMQERAYIVRELICQTDSGIVESIKFNLPFYSFNGLLCYLGLYKKKQLILGFCDGVFLPDEAGMLRADANQKYLRHWPLLENQDTDYELLASYIEEAVNYRKNKK